MPANIDFVVLGAQKAGTSSLFEYLRSHPSIHVPPEKETFFFSEDRVYRRGWDWYVNTIVRNAHPDAVCGEISTTYLTGSPYEEVARGLGPATPSRLYQGKPREQIVPLRIRKHLPNARLICVLRDPVERAYSQYRMTVMERAETRSFDQAIAELLEPEALEEARMAPARTNTYIVNGEYHRALAAYADVFAPPQLRVVFLDDLGDKPQREMASLFEFIGVAPDFLPDNLGTRYREGASAQRVRGFDLHNWRIALARNHRARAMWRGLPDRLRDPLDRAFYVVGYRVGLWNARRGISDDGISTTTRQTLIAHFRADSEALADIAGRPAPWLAAWNALVP